MEISQRRHSNRIRYEFGADELQYHLQDGSGSRSFAVPYLGISRDRQTLEERSQWLRNVSLLWMVLGAGYTMWQYMGGRMGMPSIWLFLGALCYVVYHFRRTRFTIVPSDKGNLLVIDDASGARILDEIASRRARQFRDEYDFMPDGDTPDQHRNRFRWLHREGALSDEELQQRLGVVDATDPARTPQEAGVTPGTRLN